MSPCRELISVGAREYVECSLPEGHHGKHQYVDPLTAAEEDARALAEALEGAVTRYTPDNGRAEAPQPCWCWQAHVYTSGLEITVEHEPKCAAARTALEFHRRRIGGA